MSHSPPRADDEIVERYPHYREYKACQSKAFITGSVTLLGAAACIYVGLEHWFKRYKPSISKNWMIAGPILGGTVAAYIVTMGNTVHCSNMWMAMEERHSALTSAEERQAMRLRAEEEG